MKTAEDILKLEGNALRIALATFMEWDRIETHLSLPYGRCPDTDHYVPLPRYDLDLNAIHEVEQKVIEKVGRLAWFQALCYVVTGHWPESNRVENLYESVARMTATATQRARACLLALGGGE